MSKVKEFKEAYDRFIEALDYITKNEERLKKDPVKWKQIQDNFTNKFEQPMDKLWEELTDEEKKPLLNMYAIRKDNMQEKVKTVVQTFNAKIIKGKV